LAANLTNQVRAIAEVATAVTEGDLTRQVRVEASGEVAALKDTLNAMIRNLGETTRQNVEQDWLKTNRERFTRMLQGQDNLAAVSSMILSELASLVSAQHGVFYSATTPTDGTEPVLELQAGYGNEERRQLSTSFRLGEGLVGQCAKEKKRILLTEVPGDYVRINSGLGASPPLSIIVLPVLFEGSLRAVVELASFSAFSVTHQTFLNSITESIGIVLSTIQASALTETLLRQSQSLAEELRSQQAELRQSNDGLERQASMLAERNREASKRNQDIEQSKRLLEEKAAQLAISSRYKSEFIANMSHELRTPLNSLLILAEQLEDNPDHNLTDTQVQYANVINASGKELMSLLNSVLDLAKAESGTVSADLADLSLEELRRGLLHEFEPVAQSRHLAYSIDRAPGSPSSIVSDPQRLRQILKNLLVNAFKFTERGAVRIEIGMADRGWSEESISLVEAPSVLAISVSDTGIGINDEQQQRIFEAFAQGDGTTARLYGGTGLGLSISRELARLLGGEIAVASTPGQGSTFTVYLPLDLTAPAALSAPGDDLPRARTPEETVAAAMSQAELGDVERHRRWSGDTALAVEGMRILVVDDDFRNIFALSALLERNHADVAIAESGSEALATLERGPAFDVVLMDIMMPVLDGYDTIRAIRHIDRFTTLPIIAVSGKVMDGERQRCLDAGADDFVSKPINVTDLLAALTPWLAPGARSDRTTPTPSGDPRAPAGTHHQRVSPGSSAMAAESGGPRTERSGSHGQPNSSIEGVRVLVVDDDIRTIFAVTALLEHARAEVVVAESGPEALATLRRVPSFDVVLMDVVMPAMDGCETIRAIRALSTFDTLPIIAVTAETDDDERRRCFDAGANDYVPRPTDTAELLAALRPWMSTSVPSTMP
jgi:signal transduction histidine kinase/CheY-like chemotaxis protein